MNHTVETSSPLMDRAQVISRSTSSKKSTSSFNGESRKSITPSPTQAQSDEAWSRDKEFDVIPGYVKFLIQKFAYKHCHDYCKYTDVSDIPESLKHFDVISSEEGFDTCRVPKLVEGKAIYQYQEYESMCRVCWRCSYCSICLCCDPIEYQRKKASPCTPVKSSELSKLPEQWSEIDYLFYYLSKRHIDLEICGIDPVEKVQQYRNSEMSGIAETQLRNEILNHDNASIIFKVLKEKLGLDIE